MSTPLGVDGSAELGLALDVHHASVSQPGAGGDAQGMTEHKAAHLQYGQGVDLADTFAAGVDQDVATRDLFAQVGMHPICPIRLGIDGLLYVLVGDDLHPALRGPVVRLPDQVSHRAHMGAEPFAVTGET